MASIVAGDGLGGRAEPPAAGEAGQRRMTRGFVGEPQASGSRAGRRARGSSQGRSRARLPGPALAQPDPATGGRLEQGRGDHAADRPSAGRVGPARHQLQVGRPAAAPGGCERSRPAGRSAGRHRPARTAGRPRPRDGRRGWRRRRGGRPRRGGRERPARRRDRCPSAAAGPATGTPRRRRSPRRHRPPRPGRPGPRLRRPGPPRVTISRTVRPAMIVRLARLPGRFEIGDGRADAPPVQAVDRQRAHPDRSGCVVVRRCAGSRWRRWPPRPRSPGWTAVPRDTCGSGPGRPRHGGPRRRSPGPARAARKAGQDVGEAPAGQRPAVVVGRMPAQREGGVHRRRAAGDLAPRQAERRRASGAGTAQAPVVRGGARAVRAVRQIGGHGCGRVVRDPPRPAARGRPGPRSAVPRAHIRRCPRRRSQRHIRCSWPRPRSAHDKDPGQLALACIHDGEPLPVTRRQRPDLCTLARWARGG